MKDSPSYVLPTAMIYDYPLMSVPVSTKSKLAEAFNNGGSLESHECFTGNCPS
jgi:hypothetical protein